ncbi:YggT family protein [Ligilactobacillus sp. Marseille-Q7487]|uniref:YggT family protein n=1 Tax=Ligilactobacillus sp. Marseille-Q7487 TaxID=3022128 RepID=UPI0015B3E9C2|nr:YggT family protein [Ligilactobacillus sp. Marseille-Q7487]
MFLIRLINIFFEVYEMAILVYVLMSWFPGAYQTKVGQLLTRVCQPYLNIFRFIPPILGVSFAPLVALIFLEFVKQGLYAILFGF